MEGAGAQPDSSASENPTDVQADTSVEAGSGQDNAVANGSGDIGQGADMRHQCSNGAAGGEYDNAERFLYGWVDVRNPVLA